ncbi:hypothetical protein C8Q74DRAFT_222376 [Fomes fomentarius]|nr:hypothetical protein C8Q74DRAFT_222376 [Fomes fomentarius]
MAYPEYGYETESKSQSLVGAYVVLQINAKAMVVGYTDSPISAVARALGTRKYLALVEKEVQIPTCSDALTAGWHAYRVSFVGRHTQRGRSPCTDDCLPIFPARFNSKNNVPIAPSHPLPFEECCHRPSTEAIVRIHQQPPYYQSSLHTLSEVQISRVSGARKLTSATETSANDDHGSVSPPSLQSDATSLTFRSPAASPRAEVEYFFARNEREHTPASLRTASPALSALADLALASTPTSQDFAFNRPARMMTPASDLTSTSRTETAVSALFDTDQYPEHEHEYGSSAVPRVRPRRHQTLDSASVYSTSTARSSIALNFESPSTSNLVLGLEVELDEVPLVDVSFDLNELKAESEVLPDPRGFMEERDVVIQLVQKSKERERSVASSPLSVPRPELTPPDARSEHRLSLMRVRSRQSTNTVPPLMPASASMMPRSPNKLRRVKSSQSSRRTHMPDTSSMNTNTNTNTKTLRPSKLRKRVSTSTSLGVSASEGRKARSVRRGKILPRRRRRRSTCDRVPVPGIRVSFED